MRQEGIGGLLTDPGGQAGHVPTGSLTALHEPGKKPPGDAVLLTSPSLPLLSHPVRAPPLVSSREALAVLAAFMPVANGVFGLPRGAAVG